MTIRYDSDKTVRINFYGIWFLKLKKRSELHPWTNGTQELFKIYIVSSRDTVSVRHFSTNQPVGLLDTWNQEGTKYRLRNYMCAPWELPIGVMIHWLELLKEIKVPQ